MANTPFIQGSQDDFIQAGTGGGIGWGLADSMQCEIIDEEMIVDQSAYHTIKEVKNGLGPAPIKNRPRLVATRPRSA